MNRDLAVHVVEELIKAGVEEFILCPGARNGPFVNLISQSHLKHSYAYEERSAAFFAIGAIRKTGRPVAVITTSGTAAGELLPATMEAYYSSIPLVLVTADRPRRYRGSNAPQTAEQVGLYGIYAPFHFDLEEDESLNLFNWSGRAPLHLNVCFEDPKAAEEPYLFDSKGHAFNVHFPKSSVEPQVFKEAHRPLVIVSALKKEDRASTLKFLEELGAPVYLEGVSGLRNEASLKDIQVFDPDIYQHDAVLRIGGVPTHRIWRDLEEMRGRIKVLSITEHPFSGLSWAPHICSPIGPYLETFPIPEMRWDYPEEFFQYQKKLQETLIDLLEEEPQAEPSFFYHLSQKIPFGSLVYLGNSLPIRQWDLAAEYRVPAFEIKASRGLNGIDGQLSCFFGLCEEGRHNCAILGDLTTLYDFAAGWSAPNVPYTLFVVNNKGGKIFSRRFQSEVFQHPHDYNFQHFAKFWNMPYQLARDVPQQIERGLVELVPDESATDRFWKKWNDAKASLARLSRVAE